MEITPTAEGKFYPQSSKELLKFLKKYRYKSKVTTDLAIVPHAGYNYCGEIIFKQINRLNPEKEAVTIIAPVIYHTVYGTVTSNAEAFTCPIGKVDIKSAKNQTINNELFSTEHAITVHIPILKYLFPNIKIIPILYGCENFKNLSKIIEENISKSNIIISTNLSRFIPERENIKLDNQTARMIKQKQITDLDIEMADGAIGICAAIDYAKKTNKNFIQTAQSNSAAINGDTSNVVGYGGWYLI